MQSRYRLSPSRFLSHSLRSRSDAGAEPFVAADGPPAPCRCNRHRGPPQNNTVTPGGRGIGNLTTNKRGLSPNGTYLSPKCRESCHSREGGNPEDRQKTLDSRLRGNDRMQGLWEISIDFMRTPLSKCHSSLTPLIWVSAPFTILLLSFWHSAKRLIRNQSSLTPLICAFFWGLCSQSQV